MPSSKKTANGGGSIRKKTVMKKGKEYTYLYLFPYEHIYFIECEK